MVWAPENNDTIGAIKDYIYPKTPDTEQSPTARGLSDGLFELGFIKIAPARTIACEEINLKFTQENVIRHVCDQIFPVDLAPSKKKIEFSFKKPKLLDNDLLFYMYTHYFPFDFLLYVLEPKENILAKNMKYIKMNNEYLSPKLYMVLRHCIISDVNIGNFDGTKPVTEEIQGQALYYEFSSGVSAYRDSIRTTGTLQDLPDVSSAEEASSTADVAIGNKKKLA